MLYKNLTSVQQASLTGMWIDLIKAIETIEELEAIGTAIKKQQPYDRHHGLLQNVYKAKLVQLKARRLNGQHD